MFHMSEKTQDHAQRYERYRRGLSYGKCIVILNRGVVGREVPLTSVVNYKPGFRFIVIILKKLFCCFYKKSLEKKTQQHTIINGWQSV